MNIESSNKEFDINELHITQIVIFWFKFESKSEANTRQVKIARQALAEYRGKHE